MGDRYYLCVSENDKIEKDYLCVGHFSEMNDALKYYEDRIKNKSHTISTVIKIENVLPKYFDNYRTKRKLKNMFINSKNISFSEFEKIDKYK